MALRFRKTFNIAPGLKLNIGKKSASIRVGARNAGITVGTAGKRASASLPGTGLGATHKFGGGESRPGSGIGHAISIALGVLAILVLISVLF